MENTLSKDKREGEEEREIEAAMMSFSEDPLLDQVSRGEGLEDGGLSINGDERRSESELGFSPHSDTPRPPSQSHPPGPPPPPPPTPSSLVVEFDSDESDRDEERYTYKGRGSRCTTPVSEPTGTNQESGSSIVGR